MSVIVYIKVGLPRLREAESSDIILIILINHPNIIVDIEIIFRKTYVDT